MFMFIFIKPTSKLKSVENYNSKICVLFSIKNKQMRF